MLLSLLLSLPLQATPQSVPSPAAALPPPSRAQPPVLHSSSERSSELSFAVLSTSSTGPAPASLEASQITVLLDGHPVTPVKITAAPRSLIIVIDTINSSLQQLLYIRDALQSFLAKNGGRLELPTSIVIFSDHKPGAIAGSGTQSRELAHRELFAQRLATTPDGAELSRKLQQLPLGFSRILPSQGAEGQAERVTLSLRSLAFLADSQVSVPGAKLVVWISPGWPPRADIRQSASLNFDQAVFFSEALQKAHIILNVLNSEPIINVRAANFWTDAIHFPRAPTAANSNNLALQPLALQSGGALLGNEHTIEASLAVCVQDALSLRLLTLPTPAAAASVSVHQLTLETSVPGLHLRTRPAFVMLPALAQPKAAN